MDIRLAWMRARGADDTPIAFLLLVYVLRVVLERLWLAFLLPSSHGRRGWGIA